MYAVEFEANIKNGIVQIPALFKKLHVPTKAKVIILIDEDEATVAQQPDFIDQLMENPRAMNSKGFLSREEGSHDALI